MYTVMVIASVAGSTGELHPLRT